ncbi:MAG: M91 family zinc metallopeptidase [Pseudomonas proteolytica]|uniref:M91 family zinc metallopeptidase n=1 Tax=Pseudomonas proteolytica TaxID=219574 RepID=UPI003F3068F3
MKLTDRSSSNFSPVGQYSELSTKGLLDEPGKQCRDFSNTITVSEINKPDASLLSADDGLSKTYALLTDCNVTVSRELKWVEEKDGVEVEKDNLVIEATSQADTVHVKRTKNGGVDIVVNDRTYHIDSHQPKQKIPQIHIKTLGGDDRVWVDPDVSERMFVETGDGADYVKAGAGNSRVFAGAGNDTVVLGSGFGYVEGGEGDDVLIGGSGMSAMYGNNGNDKMFAGYFPNTQKTYMDGGQGNDEMFAINGRTIMHGGRGDNAMTSYGGSHIYTGKGNNKVVSLNDTDTVFAKKEDVVQRTPGSKLVDVSYSDAGREGLKVTGRVEFTQRVQDDLELLRLSPVGQQMLAELDAAFRRNTMPKLNSDGVETIKDQIKRQPENQIITIKELEADNGYFFSRELDYNPSFIDTQHQSFPISVLQHELSHGFNWVNRSKLKGQTRVNDSATGLEDNMERQAVGLQTNEAFDFDRDPSTPPTFTNPKPFTENGLREEMGEPLRTAYKIENVVARA